MAFRRFVFTSAGAACLYTERHDSDYLPPSLCGLRHRSDLLRSRTCRDVLDRAADADRPHISPDVVEDGGRNTVHRQPRPEGHPLPTGFVRITAREAELPQQNDLEACRVFVPWRARMLLRAIQREDFRCCVPEHDVLRSMN